MTLADVSKLHVAADRRIPTLESMLELVGGRVPLLLEIKVDRNVRRLAFALERAVASYRGPYGLMSFDPRLVRQIKSRIPSAPRGLVIGERLRPIERQVAIHLADPDFVAVSCALLGKPWVARLRERMPIYSWTITTAAQRAQAAVNADALIWEGDGGPRN